MPSPEALNLFFDLHNSPLFQQALGEMVAEEISSLTTSMRGYLRTGQTGLAQWCEGQIVAMEAIPRLIEGYAKTYAKRK